MVYDVVIAGGGPVGLFLACELRLAGVSVLVLERMKDPHSAEGWMDGNARLEFSVRRSLLSPRSAGRRPCKRSRLDECGSEPWNGIARHDQYKLCAGVALCGPLRGHHARRGYLDELENADNQEE